jgi:Fe(3+) dicitrate transport protein
MERPAPFVRRTFVLFSLALSLFAFVPDASAQTPRPALMGRVTDKHAVWNTTADYRVESPSTTFFVTTRNVSDRLYIADRSRGIIPGRPRLVQSGPKLNFRRP